MSRLRRGRGAAAYFLSPDQARLLFADAGLHWFRAKRWMNRPSIIDYGGYLRFPYDVDAVTKIASLRRGELTAGSSAICAGPTSLGLMRRRNSRVHPCPVHPPARCVAAGVFGAMKPGCLGVMTGAGLPRHWSRCAWASPGPPQFRHN